MLVKNKVLHLYPTIYIDNMAKPKRSSDDYIQLNKKITDKDIRNIIGLTARDWRMTTQQVCYEFIRKQAIAEIEKRNKC